MSFNCSSVQFGLQAALDTPVAATHKWDGQAEFDFDDEIIEDEYLTGEPGGAVEDTHIEGTGSTLTLKDTPATFQVLTYALNTSIKAISGAQTSFPFTYPTGVTPNTLAMNTWEVSLVGQMTALDYEFYNAFIPTWNLHGDCDERGGQMFFNAIVKGSKAVASTATAALTFVAAREFMNLRTASWDFNAIGTAFEAGSIATPTTGTLKAFSLEQRRMFLPGYYADARTNKDFGTIQGSLDYILGGRITCLLNDTMVTKIAQARAGTPFIFQMVIPGAATVKCDIRLPMILTSKPKVLSEQKDGIVLCSFDYKVKYSRTATAQGPSINLTLASTTLT